MAVGQLQRKAREAVSTRERKSEEDFQPLQFIIDSRERYPYELQGAVTKALTVGDYSLVGMEKEAVVERKTLDDLFQCLTGRRAHFLSQLKRMSTVPRRLLLFDASISAFMLGHVDFSLTGSEALSRLLALCVRYDIPFLFADRYGSKLAAGFLGESWKLKERGLL